MKLEVRADMMKAALSVLRAMFYFTKCVLWSTNDRALSSIQSSNMIGSLSPGKGR